ncbi:M18 family aminopeptidase [Ileibacterium valens]|uniref:M18 family aminopeptidase n=1 Tax=Ileibacterium valens TaxID=1862668 RepID=UPI00272CCF24|nr:M18 family aminopeptidase [Ileibacterium valens]
MNHLDLCREMVDFIDHCPSMFHSVATIEKELVKNGFEELREENPYTLKAGHNYYVKRNNSSIIAFKIPEALENYHFQMSAAHSDSPVYKIKSVPELTGPGEYLKLDVEAYGGMIDSTWMDRPLTVAGRVLVENNGQIESRLFYIDKDIMIIPNVAIHFNRQVNDGYKFNRQVDLCPLYSNGAMKSGSFDEMVAEVLGVTTEAIIGKDLFLVTRQKGNIWGWKDEFVSSPRLDDLECAFVTLKGFVDAAPANHINVYCCFDNEEVGSNTKQGAMSTFLKDTLSRINGALGKSEDDYHQAIARSFLVSADNAHAVHPNHPEKTDAVNCSYMNKGPVIKESANQKYTTDAFSRAVFKKIANLADVPVQVFANRSDVVGGSTLGNLSNTQVSVHAVDIGLPQLAMHSSYETAGSFDGWYTWQIMKKYFETEVLIEGADRVSFK